MRFVCKKQDVFIDDTMYELFHELLCLMMAVFWVVFVIISMYYTNVKSVISYFSFM